MEERLRAQGERLDAHGDGRGLGRWLRSLLS
jgi:hypothetical protein